MNRNSGTLVEKGPVARITHSAMGTVMTHSAFGQNAYEYLDAVSREIVRIEALISRFLPESEISRVNRSAGNNSEKVSLETYAVLSKVLEYSRCCPGCFDMSSGGSQNIRHNLSPLKSRRQCCNDRRKARRLTVAVFVDSALQVFITPGLL